MANELICNYSWGNLPQEFYPRVIREFLDWGIDKLVFGDSLITRGLGEPEFIDYLRKLTKELGVSFVAMHAPYGRNYDMDIPDFWRRPAMIEDHKKDNIISAEIFRGHDANGRNSR